MVDSAEVVKIGVFDGRIPDQQATLRKEPFKPFAKEQKTLEQRVEELPVGARSAYENFNREVTIPAQKKEELYTLINTIENRYPNPVRTATDSDDYLDPAKTDANTYLKRLRQTPSGQQLQRSRYDRSRDLSDGQSTITATGLQNEYRRFFQSFVKPADFKIKETRLTDLARAHATSILNRMAMKK